MIRIAAQQVEIGDEVLTEVNDRFVVGDIVPVDVLARPGGDPQRGELLRLIVLVPLGDRRHIMLTRHLTTQVPAYRPLDVVTVEREEGNDADTD